MENKKLLLIPAALIFVLAVVSSASVTTSLFFDSTSSNSLTITDGDSVNVIVSADFIFEQNMNITVILTDSSGDLVENLLSVYTTKDSYSTVLTLDKTVYSCQGDYVITSTVKAASGQTAVSKLYLKVVPIPENHPPVITSTPILSVDEGKSYSYQVTATDADNDVLAYSLVKGPSWISINSVTGLISGIAPQVNSDTNYDIEVVAQDGKDLGTQEYTLTVKNVQTDNIPPVITVVSPIAGETYDTNNLLFEITTNEPISSAWFVFDGHVEITMASVTSTDFRLSSAITEGNHTVVFYATDLAGNTGHSNSINFVVDTTVNPPDTTKPIVTILYPANGATYTNQITNMNFTATDANLESCWYSLDNGITNITTPCNSPITGISSVQGTNAWKVYAKDLAGNIGSASVTFTVNTPQNHVPVITSTPVLSVDEGKSYSYQVTATDADNDFLIYSLSGPGWLSISSNGLVSGKAPSVSSDTSYAIVITVSDGNLDSTQAYTLTVNDLTNGNPVGGIPKRNLTLSAGPNTDFENQQYLNQFTQKIPAEEQTQETKTGNGSAILVIIGIIIFILILAVTVILIYRAMNK